jgi:hypothetical protein
MSSAFRWIVAPNRRRPYTRTAAVVDDDDANVMQLPHESNNAAVLIQTKNDHIMRGAPKRRQKQQPEFKRGVNLVVENCHLFCERDWVARWLEHRVIDAQLTPSTVEHFLFHSVPQWLRKSVISYRHRRSSSHQKNQ